MRVVPNPLRREFVAEPPSFLAPDGRGGNMVLRTIGILVKPFKWTSKIFPDTVRDCAVYVPSQYDGKTPACVMVFQDGNGYASETS